MSQRSVTRVGVDIGGTFTDFVYEKPEDGNLVSFKLPSTPDDPAKAVLKGLEMIRRTGNNPDSQEHYQVIHGSTVATNALLERKGARTAFITTRGFADLLQIGRQNRPLLYDWSMKTAAPLIPPGLRFEVDERIDSQAKVIKSLDPAQVSQLIPELRSGQVESVAVCLLFSFLYPDHERLVADQLRAAGFFVSASHEILPEFREVERASTTAVNAFVSPVLDNYLSHLQTSLDFAGAGSIRVMQSNGGNISIEQARRGGVHCILSGPAGGIIGAQTIAQSAVYPESIRQDSEGNEAARHTRVITFDMGGTSTDVSLIDRRPQVTTEAVVGGCPIGIPILDIHTIGAGGGSIAHVDLGGALRVGPESAGADPGPACYGRGNLPTVTDANLVLGRLFPKYFLGGEMVLSPSRSHQVLNKLAESLGLGLYQAALGVIEVVNAHMERALRVISIERGYDPRDFTLLSFGGAGGLHAVELARRLAIPRVLVPPMASTLSAFGMLAANVVKDYSQTVMLPGDANPGELEACFMPMIQRGIEEVQIARNPSLQEPAPIHVEKYLDARYRGQSYELTLPYSENFRQRFDDEHERTYGHSRPQAEIELVNVRVRVISDVLPPKLNKRPEAGPDPAQALIDSREVIYSADKGRILAPIYQGEALLPGNQIIGPALVVRKDTTILLGTKDHGWIDPCGNLWLEVSGESA